MNTETAKLTVTYFPYTFLGEDDLKRLILYFHSTRLLQIFPDSDPGLPDLLRTSPLVQSFFPISDSALLETVSRAHQTYHQLGSVHQDVGLTHLLRTFALQENFEDSRTGLVAKIRETHPRMTEEEIELVNDAVFILLAHQLDREHLELDLQLERIRGLEAKFHEEAGIGTDEEREALATQPVSIEESDPARTLYPFQRLRAWTRLYCLQKEMGPFLPLTTGAEVLGEIFERLPSQMAALTEESAPREPEKYLLSVLPDPQSLSLEEVLELRELLSRESILDNWQESLTAALDHLQHELHPQDKWQEIRQHLQQKAEEFKQHWPTPEKPSRYVRLECMCYPQVKPEIAFSLASSLEVSREELYGPEGANTITLLMYPAELQLDDRQ